MPAVFWTRPHCSVPASIMIRLLLLDIRLVVLNYLPLSICIRNTIPVLLRVLWGYFPCPDCLEIYPGLHDTLPAWPGPDSELQAGS